MYVLLTREDTYETEYTVTLFKTKKEAVAVFKKCVNNLIDGLDEGDYTTKDLREWKRDGIANLSISTTDLDDTQAVWEYSVQPIDFNETVSFVGGY